jgi:dTDP-4-dehydrorhamnose reductase
MPAGSSSHDGAGALVKVLVTGAGGMLGRAVAAELTRSGHDFLGLTHAEADVTKPDAIDEPLRTFRPDWVWHLAAFTRVDDCESKPDLARAVNALGSRNVAAAAAASGAAVMAISTDYVFPGDAKVPYREDAETGPRSVYGRSKLEGEIAVREVAARHAIVRTAWLHGRGGANFIDTIMKRSREGIPLRVVDDQRGSPTWTVHLAEGLRRLMEKDAQGTFHCTSTGSCTWHELAVYALNRMKLEIPVERMTTESLGRPAPRPRYSVLSLDHFERCTNWRMPEWRDAVAGYLYS